MGSADEQIRVSEGVTRELERRKRADESYNDVLERVLEVTDADFDDGFGVLSDEQADRIRDGLEEAREKRTEQVLRRGTR